jgi:hypothetical protein
MDDKEKKDFDSPYYIAERIDGDLNPHELLGLDDGRRPLATAAAFLAEIRVAGAPTREIQAACIEDEDEEIHAAAFLRC